MTVIKDRGSSKGVFAMSRARRGPPVLVLAGFLLVLSVAASWIDKVGAARAPAVRRDRAEAVQRENAILASLRRLESLFKHTSK